MRLPTDPSRRPRILVVPPRLIFAARAPESFGSRAASRQLPAPWRWSRLRTGCAAATVRSRLSTKRLT
eukprot:11568603-Alexandrium_andersonii.AAC.1